MMIVSYTFLQIAIMLNCHPTFQLPLIDMTQTNYGHFALICQLSSINTVVFFSIGEYIVGYNV